MWGYLVGFEKLWPVAGGRWPVAGGRWPVAGGATRKPSKGAEWSCAFMVQRM